MSRRAARPVEIYYYPKKAAGRSTRRLQTVETVVTQAESSEPVTARSHRTLTDEVLDPAETAFTELMRLGHEAFRAGRVNEARVVFESLVSSGRAEPFAHTMLGTILLVPTSSMRRSSNSKPRWRSSPTSCRRWCTELRFGSRSARSRARSKISNAR